MPTIEQLMFNQLSPDEATIISNELGIPREQLNRTQLPVQQNHLFTPQYNPYQYMQSYNGYYPSYYTYPQTQYNPYQYSQPTTYPYYQQYSSYPQYSAQYYEAQQNNYQQQAYMDNKFMYNPYYNYIKLMSSYDPNKKTQNTYFGYSAYNNSSNTYGFDYNDSLSQGMTMDDFLKNQYNTFARITEGVSKTLNGQINTDKDVVDHYKGETKIPEPVDYEKAYGLKFNKLIYTPEAKALNSHASHIDAIISNGERQKQIEEYNKAGIYAAREEFSRKQKEKLPDTTTLAEFLKNGCQLYAEACYQLYVDSTKKDMTNSYDTTTFGNFAKYGATPSSGYFSNMYNPVDVSDITITLPDHLKNNYDKRRDAFISAIINKNM